MVSFTHKAKTLAARVSWKRALIVYSVAVSTLAFILVIALFNANQSAQRSANETAARENNRDTLLATFDKPIINAAGDKVLVPELKLALPATTVSRTILYQYISPTYAAEGGINPEGAKFASRTAISESTKPGGSDTCNILAQISVGKAIESVGNLTQVDSAVLPGGKTIYIYQNKASCTKAWGSLDSGTMVLLLKQAVGY